MLSWKLIAFTGDKVVTYEISPNDEDSSSTEFKDGQAPRQSSK